LSNFLRLTKTSSVKIKFWPVQLTSYWYSPSFLAAPLKTNEPIAVCLIANLPRIHIVRVRFFAFAKLLNY